MGSNPLGVVSSIHGLTALHEVSFIAFVSGHAACTYNFRKQAALIRDWVILRHFV